MATEDLTGTLVGCLRLLFHKGLRFASVIDLGCADGHFFLEYYCEGIFAGARCVNVDANPIYEASLSAIKDAIGADYIFAAVSDRDGEAEMIHGAHPYWASLRPAGDIYWEQVNQLSGAKMRVPTVTVDTLKTQFGLPGPFLLKLDVQGAEAAALRGARETLADTDVVAVEADMHDLRTIDAIMDEAGFDLFDLTEMRRIGDSSLAWLYPVYLHRRRNAIRQRAFWDARANDAIVQAQHTRRQAIIARNARSLEWLKSRKR